MNPGGGEGGIRGVGRGKVGCCKCVYDLGGLCD